jgi:hypothetical protein
MHARPANKGLRNGPAAQPVLFATRRKANQRTLGYETS